MTLLSAIKKVINNTNIDRLLKKKRFDYCFVWLSRSLQIVRAQRLQDMLKILFYFLFGDDVNTREDDETLFYY
jgi:hypothetical protein